MHACGSIHAYINLILRLYTGNYVDSNSWTEGLYLSICTIDDHRDPFGVTQCSGVDVREHACMHTGAVEVESCPTHTHTHTGANSLHANMALRGGGSMY